MRLGLELELPPALRPSEDLDWNCLWRAGHLRTCDETASGKRAV